ncbi:DUF4157 domain-containing protein [Alkalinema pantanalense CENA528]|uniref:eCIS core domain-containing protein n=1 Tax=Alkalinema pantanalense TaxID=1620705 RepID=UPI003D6FD747
MRFQRVTQAATEQSTTQHAFSLLSTTRLGQQGLSSQQTQEKDHPSDLSRPTPSNGDGTHGIPFHLNYDFTQIPIHPQLTVTQPNDPTEQDADRVADRVVEQIQRPSNLAAQLPETALQPRLGLNPVIARAFRGDRDQSSSPPANLEQAIDQARPHGEPLAVPVRRSMEQAFGADFRQVRVHADAESEQLNRSIQAQAFTTGTDIFFRSGAYQPQSRSGQRLIAHELTHVMQQQHSCTNSMPIQRTYQFQGNTYKATDYDTSHKDFQTLQLSEGKFTAVQADAGLPTFYGVLKKIFANNLNDSAFAYTKLLGNSCDRPRKVSARVQRLKNTKDLRFQNPFVTAIGNLGTEELLIRDGVDLARVTAYDGGHLVGYQVVAGPGADQAWNVAPQDRVNNQFAYNNTIEEMARTADVGTIYDYHVEVKYKSLNFRVDQNQLLKHGIIKALDPKQYWEIQLPARIPQYWDAKADIVSPKGQFGKPAKDEKKGSDIPKTYQQHAANYLEHPLTHTAAATTAKYKLSLLDKSAQELDKATALKDRSTIRGVEYRMHQVQPHEHDAQLAPDTWDATLKQANFGEVKLDELTYDEVEKLEKDLVGLLKSVQGVTEVEMQDIDLTEEITKGLTEVTTQTQKKEEIAPDGSKTDKEEIEELPDASDRAIALGFELFNSFNLDQERENEIAVFNNQISACQQHDVLQQQDESAMKLAQTTITTLISTPLPKNANQTAIRQRFMTLMTEKRGLERIRINQQERRTVRNAAVAKFREMKNFLANAKTVAKAITKQKTWSTAEGRKLQALFGQRVGALSKLKLSDLRVSLKDKFKISAYKKITH